MQNFKQQQNQEKQINEQSQQKPIEQPIPPKKPQRLQQPKEPKEPKQIKEIYYFMCTGMNGCDFDFLAQQDLKFELIRETIAQSIKLEN